jgi:hypothetical protein
MGVLIANTLRYTCDKRYLGKPTHLCVYVLRRYRDRNKNYEHGTGVENNYMGVVSYFTLSTRGDASNGYIR